MASQTFSFTGAEVTFVVPAGVTSITVDMAGGQGGKCNDGAAFNGALGTRLQATLTTTPGETLRIGVGRAGDNGGPGNSGGTAGFYQGAAGGDGLLDFQGAGAGGGMSYVKRGGAADSNRVLVASGGGGSTSGAGSNSSTVDNESVTSTTATAGAAGGGGYGGGGGAGGWRGGAGGSAGVGGGAGTSMAHSTQTSGASATAGYRSGNGYVVFQWVGGVTGTNFFLGTVADDQTFSGEATIRKIQETAPANNTATTVTWTTTTVTEKTVIPVTANSAAGDSSNNNGWAFNNGGTDGIGSTSTQRRTIPAGVWEFSMQIGLNTPALLDTHALTIEANVYRVATGGGARTLLFSATSANQTGSATVTWNSASQPEIVLEAGEVIMVGYTMTSASTTALVLGANTNTVCTVTLGANTHFTVPSPGFRSRFSQIVDGVMVGIDSIVRKVKKTIAAVMWGGYRNMFTADESGFETSAAGWAAGANATVARSTAQARTGVASLANTKTVSTGTLASVSPFKTDRAVAGRLYRAEMWVRPNTTQRFVVATIYFNDSGGGLLGFFNGPLYVEAAAAWTRIDVSEVAPPGTARVSVGPTWGAVPSGEIHYVDDVIVYPDPLQLRIIAKRPMNAVMRGVATIIRRIRKTLTAVMRGVATLARRLTLFRTLSAVMRGVASLVRKVGKPISARMAGIATLTPHLTLFRSFPAVMLGVATLQRRVTAARTIAATMLGVPTRIFLRVGKPLTATMLGIPSLSRRVGLNIFARMAGVPSINRLLRKLLEAVMRGIAVMEKRATLRRFLSATMLGRARGRIEMGFEVLDRIEGGGGGTNINVIQLFED